MAIHQARNAIIIQVSKLGAEFLCGDWRIISEARIYISSSVPLRVQHSAHFYHEFCSLCDVCQAPYVKKQIPGELMRWSSQRRTPWHEGAEMSRLASDLAYVKSCLERLVVGTWSHQSKTSLSHRSNYVFFKEERSRLDACAIRLHYTVNSQTIVGSFTFTDFASSCKNFVKIIQFFAELPLTTKTDVFQYGVRSPYWILVKSQ